ncbi:hypothetical protein ACHAWF_011634 [Thalassiosira exigua]
MNSNNIQVGVSALGAHVQRIQSSVPPTIRSACFPESTSALLRNIFLAMAVLNGFLLLGSLFSMGSRFAGSTVLLASAMSVAHVWCAGLVLGGHLADAMASAGGSLGRLAEALRGASARYGRDAYAHGALLGSTVAMALAMRMIASYYGGMSGCVGNAAASASAAHNLTGGYANMHRGGSHGSFEPYAACGASGPVGFVSFLSGLLFWLDLALAAVLYSKREELLSGEGSYSSQYDEIGGSDGGGFDGDFPNAAGPRTMHV